MKHTKSLLAIILAAVLLLPAAGCSKDSTPTDPNAGIYVATKGEMFGIEIDVEDFWDSGFEIELKDKGKCKIRIDGKSASGTWSLEDGVFSFKGGGVECSGTLENGTMWLQNVLDSGASLTLVRESAPAAAENKVSSNAPAQPAESNSAPTVEAVPAPIGEAVPVPTLEAADNTQTDETPLQKQWNGIWYGLVYVYERSGSYSDIPEESSDAYMLVDIDSDGTGMLAVYLGDMFFAYVDCEAHDYGLDAIEGELADGTPINVRNWTFRAVPDYPEKYTLTDEISSDSGAIEFTIFMKQWGQSWQADIDSNFQLLPPSVKEYEIAIANGAQPPMG